MGDGQLRDGKIVLSDQPLVLETPAEKLTDFITPTDFFYVRNHFPVPKIDKSKWRLRVEGADRSKLEDPKSPRGEINFARSIPIEKANSVLLANKMNDVDLPPEHGFPLRAIVPGWYAVASIKWLQRIIVTDKPFGGYYQTLDYAFWKREGDQARLTALSEMQTKAVITRPFKGETIPVNSDVRVHGAAWTSDGEIAK